MADYSVSAVCLSEDTLADNLAAIAAYPVTDLHCDVFPVLPAAPTMTSEQVAKCMAAWPRQITVHVWSDDPVATLRDLPPPRAGDRVLIQHLSDRHDWKAQIATLEDRGWAVGLCVLPGTEHTRFTSLRITAVQVLTTTTPGHPGGRFKNDSYHYLSNLHQVRKDTGATWSVEADGGVSNEVATRLDSVCDLLVLGTNALIETGPGRLRMPGIAAWPEWNSVDRA